MESALTLPVKCKRERVKTLLNCSKQYPLPSGSPLIGHRYKKCCNEILHTLMPAIWLTLNQTSTFLKIRSRVPARRFTLEYLSPMPQDIQDLNLGKFYKRLTLTKSAIFVFLKHVLSLPKFLS